METAKTNYLKNNITGETVAFLKSSNETNGEYELLEFTMPAGGEGMSPHYHLQYEEEIEVISGELKVNLGVEEKVLKQGETITIGKAVNHSLVNHSDEEVVTYRVKITPAYQVEQMTKILFGLANDGKVDEKGVPHDRKELAVVLDMLDMRLHMPTVFRLLMNRLIKKGKKKGIDQQLINKYVNE
ncbi:cupin domain-containing protein [Bacillaceae bacterium W0354]